VSSKLPNGYLVQFVAPLKRHGTGAPTRFLVLGRKPSQRGLRPIVCAGNVFADRLDVDSGLMGPELREYVLRAFAHWVKV
jgi:hypothetical protein